MGKKLTGIAIGTDGISVVTSEAAGGRLKLVGSWRDGRSLDLSSPSLLKERLGALVHSAGIRRGPVTVSLPDTLGRVATLEFQELPRKSAEAGLLVKAGAARTMGIDQSEYRLDAQAFDTAAGKKAFCAAIKKQAMEPIEEALVAAGLKVSGVSLHSFNLINLLPSGDEDGALIARCIDFVTVVFFRDGVPEFYRCKAVEGNGAEAVREIAASFAFYKGRNPGSEGKVYLIDETGRLAGSLPDSIKANAVPFGAEFMNSREPMPGVLPALGSCMADA